MKADRNTEAIETTVGELIAVVTDAAAELGDGDEREAYVVASLVLEEILRKAPFRSDVGAEIGRERRPERTPAC